MYNNVLLQWFKSAENDYNYYTIWIIMTDIIFYFLISFNHGSQASKTPTEEWWCGLYLRMWTLRSHSTG